MLHGLRNCIDVNEEILCDPTVFQQVSLCAQRAWDHIPVKCPTEGYFANVQQLS
jgi:hypothetical protein